MTPIDALLGRLEDRGRRGWDDLDKAADAIRKIRIENGVLREQLDLTGRGGAGLIQERTDQLNAVIAERDELRVRLDNCKGQLHDACGSLELERVQHDALKIERDALREAIKNCNGEVGCEAYRLIDAAMTREVGGQSSSSS
jgi:hypothetical protein